MHDNQVAGENEQEQPQAEEEKQPTRLRTISKDLAIKLTEAEFAEKGKAAAEKRQEINKLEIEFEFIKKGFQSKIKLAEAELSETLRIISAGYETREVECEEKADFDRGVVEIHYKGDLYEERPMTPFDRQATLPV